MWRSFFLAVGVFVFLMGVECLGVQKFVLKSREERQATLIEAPQLAPNKVLSPPDWAPWSLMSTGAVVCLYCFSVPKAGGG
jgi:hypothetical protein